MVENLYVRVSREKISCMRESREFMCSCEKITSSVGAKRTLLDSELMTNMCTVSVDGNIFYFLESSR
jgi:hypothetical protein